MSWLNDCAFSVNFSIDQLQIQSSAQSREDSAVGWQWIQLSGPVELWLPCGCQEPTSCWALEHVPMSPSRLPAPALQPALFQFTVHVSMEALSKLSPATVWARLSPGAEALLPPLRPPPPHLRTWHNFPKWLNLAGLGLPEPVLSEESLQGLRA